MRMDGEITAVEYAMKKEELVKEKQKYKELMADTNQRAETWLDRAEKLFSFAETAKERFENGSLDDKRQILSCLGSNLTLTDRRLKIDLESSLSIFPNSAPEVQALHSRLEPNQVQVSQEVMDGLYTENKEWGAKLS